MATLLAAAPALGRAAVFDFEEQAFDAVTPLAITNSGLTATFTNVGTSAIGITSLSPWSNLSGNYLGLPPFGAFFDGQSLLISFSQSLSSLRFDYGLGGDTTLTVISDSGFSATIPGGAGLPRGAFSVGGPAFTQVTLTSAALDFALDNLVAAVAPAAVPAPGGAALLLAFCGVAGAAARRRA